MRKLLAALAMLAASAMGTVAQAQNFPSRPITLVVPFAAGGPTDTISRIFADRLRASLGQTVVVENTTGAAGTIGTGRVVRAAPTATRS
jgi:tripartite-type tricarboxylate transporter receptor subunit TctC